MPRQFISLLIIYQKFHRSNAAYLSSLVISPVLHTHTYRTPRDFLYFHSQTPNQSAFHIYIRQLAIFATRPNSSVTTVRAKEEAMHLIACDATNLHTMPDCQKKKHLLTENALKPRIQYLYTHTHRLGRHLIAASAAIPCKLCIQVSG